MSASQLLRELKDRADRGIEAIGSRTERAHRSVGTVTLFVGPYRNLTTLTSALLALHPEVQVLNHAGSRLFEKKSIDFLRRGGPRVLDRFVQHGLHLSRSGERGPRGGSILLAHAFDDDHLRSLYSDRYGQGTMKPSPRALVWKESMKVTNLLRSSVHAADELLNRHPRVRLLLPIRHPLDCVASNLMVGTDDDFVGDAHDEILEELLDVFWWFETLSAAQPDRTMWFSQRELGAPDLFVRLATLLEVDADVRWIDECSGIGVRPGKYFHDARQKELLRTIVEERFSEGRMRAELLRFAADD